MTQRITPPPPLKRILWKSSIVRFIISFCGKVSARDYFGIRAQVINNGSGSYVKRIYGSNNSITVGNNTILTNTEFKISGSNNSITIGDNCAIGKGCSFWMEGNNISILIGDNTTFTQFVHFNAQEEGSKIVVGNNVMFSNHIIVRTSDAHPIFDMETNRRINPAKDVFIGNDVWIAPDSKILKGALIEDGCIIGSNTMVSKTVPSHSLAVGMPAKVVRSGVRWSREDVRFHKFDL